MSIMAQDGSIKLPVTSTASPVACEPPQGQPVNIDMPMIAAPQFKGHGGQQPGDLNWLKSGSDVSDNDEVQFVFSAPRRRKRKRKRFDFSYSPSMLNQCSVPPADPPPKPGSTTSFDPLRPRSLGVLKQLESCHIGAHESKVNVIRSGSLPIAPSTTVPVSNTLSPWFPDPIYNPVPAHQPPSHSSSIPGWKEPRHLAQTNSVSSFNWRPLHIEDPVSKKRKLGSERGAAETQRLFRQSSQISPRTTPNSILPPTQSNARNLGVGSSHMLWTSAMPSMSAPQPSNLQILPQWSDFDWNAFDKLGAAQYGSQPSHQTMPMDITILDTQRPANLSHQPRVGQLESQDIWQQNMTRVSSPQMPQQSTFESAHGSRPFQSNYRQFGPQQMGLQRSTTSMNLCIPTSQSLTAQSQSPNYNGTSRASPNLHSFQRNVQSQKKKITTSTSPMQVGSQTMRTEPSDLLRKPSLYTIPAWPATPDARPVQVAATSRALAHPSSFNNKSNTTRNEAFQSELTFNALRQPSSLTQPDKPSSRNFDTSSPQRASNASNAQRADGGAANAVAFNLPRARAGRKHCPNLIVDIAETCQELFPFADVAERHSVPIKKVFDTFSAIIQLPLLRNADDRRRHGSLGKRRMREYRDARKAMEKAQEAERKAQMKAMKTRVEEAGKKGKGPNDPSGLLKAAILNNANQAPT